jgi:hypothetical protein
MGEDVYGIKEKLKISFWFEGGFKISGDQKNLSLNFKDEDLLVLSVMDSKTMRTFRIFYSKMVCFELIRTRKSSGSEPEDVFFRN